MSTESIEFDFFLAVTLPYSEFLDVMDEARLEGYCPTREEAYRLMRSIPDRVTLSKVAGHLSDFGLRDVVEEWLAENPDHYGYSMVEDRIKPL